MFYPTTLVDYLENAVLIYPNKTALVIDGLRMTYSEIYHKVKQLAQGLLTLGLLRGDRVIICLDNRVETVIAIWAVWMADGVVSIIHPDTAKKKINYIIEDSAAAFMFIKGEKNISQAADNCPDSLKKIVVVEGDVKHEKVIRFNELLTSFGEQKYKRKTIDIDLAAIIYTSGSTGLPKGVMLTHRAMLTASTSIFSYLKIQPTDIVISALPLSFDYGLYQVILTFLAGATLVQEKDFTWPVSFLKKMAAEKATLFPGVATMFSILGNYLDQVDFDFDSLRCVTNTGAVLLPKHISLIKSLFPKAVIFSMYGLTECKRCTYLPPADIDKKPNSVGVAIPNTEMWIVDEQDNKAGAKQIGQLVIRGSTIMQGYWNKPVESERVLKSGPFPGEKILYTGDYGYLDDDGYFYFCGRIDEVVKRYGEKVSLREIEETVYLLPAVSEVAVIDFPDDILGVSIVAFISSLNNQTSLKDAVMQHCQKLLAKSHWPKEVFIFPELPKNSNGKLDKSALKEWYARAGG